MMNKQNQRFFPIAPPLIEMMDLVTSNQEINYLLQMGTGLYDYKKALKNSNMAEEEFQPFFEKMKRKGLVYIKNDESDRESYRLNAIAVGWYETMMHYMADVVKSLGSRFNLPAIAQNLFRVLREFDGEGVDVIIAEGIPAEGLGLAVMNRLRKASAYTIIKAE